MHLHNRFSGVIFDCAKAVYQPRWGMSNKSRGLDFGGDRNFWTTRVFYRYIPFASRVKSILKQLTVWPQAGRIAGLHFLKNVWEGGHQLMSQDEVFKKVKAIIVDQLGVEDDQVKLGAKFRDDLEADSLDLVELIMAFEEAFGGEISDEEAQNITTVGEAVTYLQENM
jgi:acyl carrier protein